jgi:hypothetical protein
MSQMSVREAGYREFVDGIAREVDEECTRSCFDEPSGPYPEFDLEGAYKLDAERRVGKRKALLQHMEQALAYKFSGFGEPNAAIALMREELEKLRPYWGPGVTKEEAVRAYMADHQNEGRNAVVT